MKNIFSLRRPAFLLKKGMRAFVNGKFIPEEKAVISVFDRGFLYGDGLFEAIRVHNGKPFRWQQHMERLRQGAGYLRIKLPLSSNQLRTLADTLITKNKMPDSVLRITISRGIGKPGYSPAMARKPTLTMSLRPAPKVDSAHPLHWKLITSSIRVPANDPLARIKTSNKLPQILARAEADDAGADEALLANTDGFVAEGTSSNVFWVRRGVVYTPPLAAGILPGVTRAMVFEIAGKLNIPIREKNIRPKDLVQADGVFLSLTSRGIVEVASLDGKLLKTADLTNEVWSGYRNELTPPAVRKGLRD